jgi:glycine dehydrogenase
MLHQPMSAKLSYDPNQCPREKQRHYISATDKDIQAMLAELGLNSLEDLYKDVPEAIRMSSPPAIPAELEYDALLNHVNELADKNHVKLSFLGHGIQHYKTPSVVSHLLGLRNLTTAYTPYQPERSQGTLTSLWIYQSAIAQLTGFEAVNASFYDRATATFEAIKCAQRLVDESDTAIVFGSLYSGDIETIQTLARDTDLKIEVVPVNANTGVVNLRDVENAARQVGKRLACIVFPQVNALGNLEDVDGVVALAETFTTKAVAVVDPMLLAPGALKPPSAFGKKGAHLFVAEGQHLAIPPNFGGPGLGIFGIRCTDENKNDIRQTAGRFVGKGKDLAGRDCYAIVLSTREQHIRREKATSNICSNQSYLATLTGGALLERGDEGLKEAAGLARKNALRALEALTSVAGVSLAFPETPFFHEFVLALPEPAADFVSFAAKEGIHAGVDVSHAVAKGNNFLLVSFTDRHTEKDLEKLAQLFSKRFPGPKKPAQKAAAILDRALRKDAPKIPRIPVEKIKSYYESLGNQNVSPDDQVYALGSCTMKYNPYINDYAATLPNFADLHPEVPTQDAQGALEVMYLTQEYFKAITGLPALTTQPMAGAQGELVGLKMFQAYHRDRGENRDVLLIPRSAHGTNPATATMAGYDYENIKLIEADATGQMNFAQVKELVAEFGPRIAGVMVTNPNTSGVLEAKFREVAELVHRAGGLVYMDGANMNAIAGWVDLGKLGVDAVHNNTHKTWSIPHGGGGPGDAFVAVSDRLKDYLPGVQVVKEGNSYRTEHPKKSIGSVQRHFGNFAHKVRCYTYLRALGQDGIRRMSAVAVLSARYLHKKLAALYPTLPVGAESTPRMHEFIITLSKESFAKIEVAGIPRANVIGRIGKLFLDFGIHAPTVAFPEVYGLMIEPTESYTKAELDDFIDTVTVIHKIIHETPEVLKTVPHFTPIDRVDEVMANKNLQVSEKLSIDLPKVLPNRVSAQELMRMSKDEVWQKIKQAHAAAKA